MFPFLTSLRGRLAITKAYVRYGALIGYYRIRYPRKSVFGVIHQKRAWGTDSSSGGGSDLKQTASIRESLPAIFKKLSITTVLDAPCGDYHWWEKMPLDVQRYIGVDIVPELIRSNQEKYASEKAEFQCVDITKDRLPKVDIVVCRDCFVHMSNRKIKKALRGIKNSGSKYLLTTTYPGRVKRNWNIVTGMWRPLDLQKPPFSLPAPFSILNEDCTEKTDYEEKSLGLWEIEAIPF